MENEYTAKENVVFQGNISVHGNNTTYAFMDDLPITNFESLFDNKYYRAFFISLYICIFVVCVSGKDLVIFLVHIDC